MKIRRILSVLLITASLVVVTVVITKSIQLNQDCTGYLKRAANSNSVELAYRELSVAIDYLEKHNLTSGYTSVLWRTPNEDIGFWYENLKQCQSELKELLDVTDATTLEKTNALMKLRESLMEGSESGDTLIIPNGLSRYPNNGLYGTLLGLSIIFICVGSLGFTEH